MKISYRSIELLESRIAPANLTGQSISFHDVDGDLVKVTASSGILHAVVIDTPDAQHQQLTSLNAGSAPHANISFLVTKSPTGDGLVNVGTLTATGVDLGNITIPGDLADIDCGSGSATVPAIKSLVVRSLGQLGVLTGATLNGQNTVQSDIVGGLPSLVIAGNLSGVSVNIVGKLGTVTIGGSLQGGSTVASGELSATGGIGTILIKGNLEGGSNNFAGSITTFGGIKSLIIKGSVVGGSALGTGYILNGGVAPLGLVKVAGDLQGGGGTYAGSINSYGPINAVTVSGSVKGGSGDHSGSIVLQAGGKSIGAIKIGQNLFGGFNNSAGSILSSGTLGSVAIAGSLFGDGVAGKTDIGEIKSAGAMGAIKINGEMKLGIQGAGAITSGGALASVAIGGASSGGINAVTEIGPVTVGGFFTGDVESTAGGLTSLLVKGDFGGNNTSSINGNIGSITILGSLIENTTIQSTNGTIGAVSVVGSITGASGISSGGTLGPVKIGGDLNQSQVASDAGNVVSVTVGGSILGGEVYAVKGSIGTVTVQESVENAQIVAGFLASNTTPIQIGTIKVGGDWIASSVSAGFKDMGNNGYGNADDVLVAQSSKIAAITIAGQILGTSTAGDHYGFDAHSIGSLKVGTNTLALPAAPNDLVLSFITGGDVTVHLK